MTEREGRMLKSEDNKICKLVPGHNFAQRLNFSHCERNTLINTADVINVNKTKSKELLIETFLSILAWMLQLAVVTKLPFIADFFDPRNENWFTLDCCNSRTQIHKVTDGNRDNESNRGCWNYSDGLGSQRMVVWSSGSFEFGRCSTSSCNSTKLAMLELL